MILRVIVIVVVVWRSIQLEIAHFYFVVAVVAIMLSFFSFISCFLPPFVICADVNIFQLFLCLHLPINFGNLVVWNVTCTFTIAVIFFLFHCSTSNMIPLLLLLILFLLAKQNNNNQTKHNRRCI